MKKVFYSILTIVLIMSFAVTCYAGDVPETLLGAEEAQVYFGEVKGVDGESITVIQKQNIKGGGFVADSEITYPDFVFTENPKAGEIYLCGYLDENNPLYIWEVSSQDTAELKITNQDDMSRRMEKLLNEGAFQQAAASSAASGTENTAAGSAENSAADSMASVGIIGGADGTASVSVIGGADGPTSVFLAGKLDGIWSWMNLLGLIIVVLMLVPNMIYAVRFRGVQNRCTNRTVNILEQVGRYGSMLFMVVNPFGEYGFSSVGAFLTYLFGNGILLLGYWIVWMLYFWKQKPWKSMTLAVLPTLMFLLSGITLESVLLTASAVIFGAAHIYITWQNVKGGESVS